MVKLTIIDSVLSGAGLDNIHIENGRNAELDIRRSKLKNAGRHNIGFSDKAKDDKDDNRSKRSGYWHEGAMGKVAIGVIVAVIAFGAIAMLKHFLGL